MSEACRGQQHAWAINPASGRWECQLCPAERDTPPVTVHNTTMMEPRLGDQFAMYIAMKDAVEKAQHLGAQIERVEFNQQPDRYYWSFKGRHSSGHWASFSSAESAAEHFIHYITSAELLGVSPTEDLDSGQATDPAIDSNAMRSGGYKPSGEMRWIMRQTEKVLQQRWERPNPDAPDGVSYMWVDVPTVKKH